MRTVLAVAMLALSPVPDAAVAPPVVVPAVQEWVGGGGGFSFGKGATVVAESAVFGDAARGLAGDLSVVGGQAVGWRVGGGAGVGDIVLREGRERGYRLTIAPTLVVAGGPEGVFNGTQTVLQMVRQRRVLPGGSVRDWPTYPERGLMLDVGRQYMSMPWIRQRVREMAYLKLNHLHLHLSDKQGFRLESVSHPEVVAERHYTKAEIRELVEYAARLGVRVVPEIDFPGHMDAILAAHPDLRLVDRRGVVRPGFIDLAKPGAYRLIGDLIGEFLPLFPSEYFHIGGDEYVSDYDDYPQLAAFARERFGPGATGKDAYHGFLNWANGLVRAGGKTTRMWNDGLRPGGATVPVDRDIVVEHWSMAGPVPWLGGAYSPRELSAAGYRVQNAAFTPTYFATGSAAALLNTDAATMYSTWDPSIFVDRSRLAGGLGAVLHVWCDDPDAMGEARIAGEIHDRLRVMAQHTWRSPAPALYPVFLNGVRAVGGPPA